MSGINGKRVLLGGFIAGAIIIAFEMASHFLVGAEWAAQLQRLGIAAPGESAMFAVIPNSLLLGSVAIWVYALATARLGSSIETACMVGIVVWAVSCLMFNVLTAALGIVPLKLAIMGALVGIVQIPVAVIAGSRVYRDEGVAGVRAIGTRAA